MGKPTLVILAAGMGSRYGGLKQIDPIDDAGEASIDYGLLMAGATLASIPIIIIFLVFQKYFTKGITMGAVKG